METLLVVAFAVACGAVGELPISIFSAREERQRTAKEIADLAESMALYTGVDVAHAIRRMYLDK